MDPQPVTVTNWPPASPGSYEVITLPTGKVVRVDYVASFGDLLVAAALVLTCVVIVGGRIFDRLRGVL